MQCLGCEQLSATSLSPCPNGVGHLPAHRLICPACQHVSQHTRDTLGGGRGWGGGVEGVPCKFITLVVCLLIQCVAMQPWLAWY